VQRAAANTTTATTTGPDGAGCARCGHRITRTGVIAAADQQGDTAVGFCGCCRIIQAERDGVWEPLGHGL